MTMRAQLYAKELFFGGTAWVVGAQGKQPMSWTCADNDTSVEVPIGHLRIFPSLQFSSCSYLRRNPLVLCSAQLTHSFSRIDRLSRWFQCTCLPTVCQQRRARLERGAARYRERRFFSRGWMADNGQWTAPKWPFFLLPCGTSGD